MLVIDAQLVLRHPMPFLYGIMSDVKRYPAFFPLCSDVNIQDEIGESLFVHLKLGGSHFTRFLCAVRMHFEDGEIVAHGENWPGLEMRWKFMALDGARTSSLNFILKAPPSPSIFSGLRLKTMKNIGEHMAEAIRKRADQLAWRPALAAERPVALKTLSAYNTQILPGPTSFTALSSESSIP